MGIRFVKKPKDFKYVAVGRSRIRGAQLNMPGAASRNVSKVGGATATGVTSATGAPAYVFLEGGVDTVFEWCSWANDPNNTSGIVVQSKISSGGFKNKLGVRAVDPEAETPEYEIAADVLIEQLPVVPPRMHHHPDGIMLRTGLGSRYSQNLNLAASALQVLGVQDVFSAQPTVFLDEDTIVSGPAAYPSTSGHIYKVEDPITGEIKTYCLTYNMYDRTMVLWDVANPSVIIDGVVLGVSGWWVSPLDQRPDLYFSKDGSRAVALNGAFRGNQVDFYDYHIGYVELSIDVSTTGLSVTVVNDAELLATDEIYGFPSGRVPIAADFSYEDLNNSLVFAYAELWGIPAAAEETEGWEPPDSPYTRYTYYAPLSTGGTTQENTGTPLYTSFPYVDLVFESEDPEQGEILRKTLTASERSAIPSGFSADYSGVLNGMDLRYRAVNYTLDSSKFGVSVLGSQAFGRSVIAYSSSETTSLESLKPPEATLTVGGPSDATVLLFQVLGRTGGGIGLDHQGEIYVHPHTKLKSWVTSYGFYGSAPLGNAEYTDETTTAAAYVKGSLVGGFAIEYKKFVPVPPEEQLNGIEINYYSFAEPQPTLSWDYQAFLSSARYPTPVRAGVWIVYKKDTSGLREA